ncbi:MULTISPECIES: RNA-directed DNA polymerase [Shewanella]|uniref:RNA-directed DNA polymerase n=2 Tax=Shewanellaceae TaxID=267890 RepID=UPI0006D17669|nr:RNA-directed DNA polymerase [Shewanella algae]PBQ25552.1 hypothetical protein AYI97_19275 [Shewanella algae]QNH99776.1 RNA-directed DNA polymerase [Shewanella algae]TVP00482.1 hypothetical protein AYI73_21480 [Shewanella algae]
MKLKDFLTKGFLPKEFPSLFDSSDLSKTISYNDNVFKSDPKISRPTKTSIPKSAGFRRSITMPNPKHYSMLVKFLVKHSREIERFYNVSKISMSKAISKNDSSRAIVNEYNFEQVMQEKINKGYSSRFLLTADISKFYNTIYTHSIPWAIHTKDVSKRDRTDNLWGNELDRLVRNMQDGQTLGIPIGPDASRVISELIGVALDRAIQNSEPELNGIRFIDDFFFFADTASEAESLDLKINRALSEFELTANENKSSIESMPVPIESLQLQTIRHYKIRKNAPEQKLDIIHLYNIAIDVHKNHPQENSFHYFLTKVMPIKIHEDNWKILESILLQISICEPKSITVVSKILISYKSYGYPLNLGYIKAAFLKVAKKGIDNNFGYEICWSFWVLSQLGVTINEEIIGLSSINDSMAILSVLTAREKGIYNGRLDTNYWDTIITNDGLYDSSWMLSYEAENRGWLTNQNGIDVIGNDQYFKNLRSSDVSFLNMDSTINPMVEEELHDETEFDTEIDMFELIYGT